MNFILNLSTRNKLLLGFGLMFLLLLGIAVTAYSRITTLQQAQKQLYEKDFANAVDAMSLESSQIAQQTAFVQMLVATTPEERESIAADARARIMQAGDTIARIRQRSATDTRVLALLNEVQAVRGRRDHILNDQFMPLLMANREEEARHIMRGPLRSEYDQLRKGMRDLVQLSGEHAQAAVSRSQELAAESIRLLVGAAALALLIAVATVVLLGRLIADPLREITRVAEQVAAGDLTAKIQSSSRHDEVGIMAQTFNRMIDRLCEVNCEIRDGVNVLAASTSQILAGTAQLAAGSAETAASVSQTTTTVEEVKQTVHLSNEKAHSVSEQALHAVDTSETGRRSVEDTVEGMHRIKNQMGVIAESIVQLSEQSQAIGEIINTVNDLSEQSNLLAVNAAIEAAKAGEHGRGFGVVAQEVKSLAMQSKQATAQIRSILSDVQKATAGVVMATEQGTRAVELGVERSSHAGEAIRLLSSSVDDAAQAATQIAASAQQQLVGIEQVVLAMENIKQASAQNVLSTRQTEEAVRSLYDLGKRLQQILDQYKVA